MTTPLRIPRWRLLFVASGVLLFLAGPMHPASEAEDPLREELATMMSDDAWVPAHSIIALSTLLLAGGLWLANRERRWPPGVALAGRAAAIAMAAYSVETVLHLASVLDTDRLEAGEFAPIVAIHLALAAVLYPISGLAIANLARQLSASWPTPAKVFGAAGVVGGLTHAVSVPATLVFSETETSPLFAMAGILLATWSVAVGLVGARTTARVDVPREAVSS